MLHKVIVLISGSKGVSTQESSSDHNGNKDHNRESDNRGCGDMDDSHTRRNRHSKGNIVDIDTVFVVLVVASHVWSCT